MPLSPWPSVRTRCREAPPDWRAAWAAAAAEPWSRREAKGSWGGGGWGPARARSPALPGRSLCLETRSPEPAMCREPQQLRGPRATEPRLFMADPPSGGALGSRGPGVTGAPPRRCLQGLSQERPARSRPRGSCGECTRRAVGTGSCERVAGPGRSDGRRGGARAGGKWGSDA